MIKLPALSSLLQVALVYNQKKEGSTDQSSAEGSNDPPSSRFQETQNVSSQSTSPSPPSIPNDRYAEWDTFETVDAIRNALAEIHEVHLVEADLNAYDRLRELMPDIVFNVAEGFHGVSREAQIPGMLEMLRIPYTGSDPLTLSVCLDKSRAKEVLAYHHIDTPKFSLVSTDSELEHAAVPFPCIVKPLHEGSSKGIFDSSVVRTWAELHRAVMMVLERYAEPALVEEYLPGREFTVAMIGNGTDLTVLPIVEIRFDSLPEGVNPIYSYEAKWIWDRSDAPLDIFECPAMISPQLREEIESVCCRAYNVLRCRDWCRIDVRLDSKGIPYIIELNPLPGILPRPEDNSCFPKAARAVGMSYNELIQTVLAVAAKRYGMGEFAPSFVEQLRETA